MVLLRAEGQVRLNAIPSMLSLLSHENPDIAVDAIEVLHELTDGDVVEDSAEEAQARSAPPSA